MNNVYNLCQPMSIYVYEFTLEAVHLEVFYKKGVLKCFRKFSDSQKSVPESLSQ